MAHRVPQVERHFVAYGVRIGLRADRAALLDAFEQDALRQHLPFGSRAVEDHEADAAVAVRYELRGGGLSGASPPYRVYAGDGTISSPKHAA